MTRLVVRSRGAASPRTKWRGTAGKAASMNFSGSRSKVPEARAIWLFWGEDGEGAGKKDRGILDELLRQLDRYRVEAKREKKDAGGESVRDDQTGFLLWEGDIDGHQGVRVKLTFVCP